MKLFAQIRKVDEAKRLVFGRAAEEVVDKAGEIMDYATSKPHFVKWSEDVAKDSDGKSLGNVRAMHGKVAAGKLTDIAFDDAAKAVDVVAKVVDDGEWKKVLEGVYTGFSIGGSYVGEKKVEKVDGQERTRYTAKPSEVSLVDRPCIPTAKFFEVQKADGTLAKVDFAQPAADEAGDVQVDGTPEQIAELGKLMNESGLALGDIIKALPAVAAAKVAGTSAAPAAAPVAAPAPIAKVEAATLRKGVYDCSSFSSVLASLISLQRSAAYEAFNEGDGSPLAAKIGAIIAMVGQVFKELIDEVIGEAKAGTEAMPALVTLAEQAAGLAKAEGAAFAKLDADPLFALIKAGARHSADDKARLGKIHDLCKELGHECDAALKVEKTEVTADPGALEKLLDEKVAPLQKALDTANGEIEKLKAQPAPARVALRAISKAADIVEDPQAAVAKAAAPIVDDLGDKHDAAGLIKSLHAKGGVALTLPAALRS